MSCSRSRLIPLAAFCAVALLCAGTAHAYSDPSSFKLSAEAAGGGGRYFTGSPADGYTCKVCHEGGAEPKLDVRGLPLAGYRPSTSYEVTISWPMQFKKMSLALELTDNRGDVAGRLELPNQAEAAAPELCDPAADHVLAAQLSELAGGRQILNVPDCGSRRVRFLWTAPSSDRGQVWFAGSAVSSDGESDPVHDGVTDFGRVLGGSAVASETTAQCSVHREAFGRAHGSWLSLSSGMLAALAWRFRSRRRRLRRARELSAEGREYDMRHGDPSELPAAERAIAEVPLPKLDPVRGSDGPLHEHWYGKKRCSAKVLARASELRSR